MYICIYIGSYTKIHLANLKVQIRFIHVKLQNFMLFCILMYAQMYIHMYICMLYANKFKFCMSLSNRIIIQLPKMTN